MTNELGERMRVLVERRCTLDFVREYYGLDLRRDSFLIRDYSSWLKRLKGVEAIGGDSVDRWYLELYLQNRELNPVKWAAVDLGMTLKSLRELLDRLDDVGPILRYHASPDLTGRSLREDLAGQIAGFRSHLEGGHSASCRRLHARLNETLHINIEEEPCATSSRLGQTPPEIANCFDILSLEPLSGRYQCWLSNGKWMSLPPDRCSILYYYEHREILKEFAARDGEPEIPSEVAAAVADAR